MKIKKGYQKIPAQQTNEIINFIKSKKWCNTNTSLPTAEDEKDILLKNDPLYGNMMLSFDFFLTENGPKIIEINIGADNFSAVFQMLKNEKRGVISF